MGILGSLGLDEIIRELGETARQVLPDPKARREFELKLQELQDRAAERVHEEALAQTEVNRTEAGHASVFVAGWRPAIGWVCAAGLGWNFFVAPLLMMFKLSPGMLPIEGLITMSLTMLGASGIRTFELTKGVARDKLTGPRTAAPVEAMKELAKLPQVPTDEENAPWNRVN